MDNPNSPDKLIYSESLISGIVHESLEDPISQIMYDISENISPTLHKLKISPNQITTLRLFAIIIAFVCLFEKKLYKYAALLIALSFFGDCLDGHMARKYNMDSTFGDYFDHFVDIFTHIIILYYLSIYIHPNKKWVICLIVLLLFMSLVHGSCKNRYLKKIKMNTSSNVMEPLNCLCPQSLIENDKLEEVMQYTKLFGSGMYQLAIIMIIWNYKHLTNN